MADEPDVRVERRADRYEILRDGEPVGFTAFYTDDEGRVVFPHTVVDPAYKGHGYASTLIAEALADEVRRGDTIVPLCPFVVKYLATHEVPGLKIARP